MFHLVRARVRFQRALRLWRAEQTASALHHGERAMTMFAACAARRPGNGPDELVAATLAMAGFRVELADHATAERLCLRALAALDTRDDRRLRAEALLRLGNVRRLRADFDRAEEVLRTAVALADRPPSDPALSGAAHNALGIVFKDTGRYRAAAREYDIALGLSGAATDLAPAVHHNLAGLAYAEGRFAAAETWARQGLALRERADPAGSTGVAGDITVLGAVLVALERYAQAEELFRRALAIWTTRHGPEHYEVSVCLHNLAVLQHRRGEPDAALRSFQEALRIRQAVLGAAHPEIAVVLNNLAILHEDQGRPGDAAECRRRVACAVNNAPSRHRH
jgi:tetratricopeptide (TPR) repeat protein